MGTDCVRSALRALVLVGVAASTGSAPAAFFTFSQVSKVDAGAYHTCAIGPNAIASCWGSASPSWMISLLGRTTFPGVAAPVESLPPVTDIAVGQAQICAVTTAGSALCYGDGNLGGGSGPGPSTTPVRVTGLDSGVSAITVGGGHACAIAAGGAAKCWGANSEGQLGNGLQEAANVPVDVSGFASGVTTISAGGFHTCAIIAGAAQCWGMNHSGQVGDGSTSMRSTPAAVHGLDSNVTRISAGFLTTCAVHAGAAKCWGDNQNGRLGDGTLAPSRAVPAQVVGLTSGIVDIVVGTYHACAVRGSGELYCWGMNDAAQLGDGTRDARNTPVLVPGLSGPVQSVAVGDSWTCARLASGTLECFGANHNGQLGIGSLPSRFAPVDAALGAGPLVAIAGGEAHSCGIGMDGIARCWGGGLLGDGSTVAGPFAVQVALPAVATISPGRTHSCASTPAGQAYCWGDSSYGQLGIGMTFGLRPLPELVPGLAAVTQISAGAFYSCAVDGGAVKCWGGNTGGNHPVAHSDIPALVPGLTATAVSVSTGQSHACVRRVNGGIKCWGANFGGELGDGTRIERTSPVDVVGLSNGSKALAVGAFHSCAITSSNAALCWGRNGSGQLGDGTQTGRLAPTPVAGLQSGVLAIAAGQDHTCALTSAGAVKCWGSNSDGQLGRALPVSSSAQPIDVALPGAAVAIAAGTHHSCALLAGGAAKCWGRSGSGQLGNGDTLIATAPQTVVASDFPASFALASSANPALHGQPVEISASITGGDVPASGYVVLRRGSETLCEPSLGPGGFVGVAFGGSWKCTVLLSPGTHTLVASYLGDAMHSPAIASLQQVVTPIPGHNCAGFDDVSSNDPLCRNVDWVRNRGITLGCSASAYCSGGAVTRLSMAAFMNRTGSALSPYVVTSEQGFNHWLGSSSPACMTANVPAADYPRQAFVDFVITAGAAASVDVDLWPSTSNSTLGFAVSGEPLRVTFDELGPKSVRVSGSFTIPPAASPSYSLWASRLGGNVDTLSGSCSARVFVTSRDETHAPYDR